MQTAFVARLALAAFAAAPILASGLTAQDTQDAFTSAPRLRVADESDKPMLGVMVTDTDDGVLIEDILEGTLAERAGLQPGDLLLKLGGRSLDTYTDIGDILAGIGAGGTVSMTVVREGEGLVKLDGNLDAPEPEPEDVEDEWLADGHQGGFLGVELGGGDHGVTVAGVIDNTAAWFAGLEAGDVLTHIDGTALDDNEDLVGAVSSKAPGTMISIAYDRDGVASKTHVRLGHRMPMMLPGMPGSGQLPGVFGEGDMWFSEDMGQPHGLFVPGHGGPSGMRFKLHGDGGDFKVHDMGDLHEHLQELHENFEFDGGEHQIKIKIEDGVMTIDRDGEIEVHELEGTAGLHGMDVEHLFGQGHNSQIAIFGADGELHGLEGLADLAELHDLADIEIEMAECADAIALECAEIAAECEALAAECAAMAVECEAKVECDTKAECEVEVECDEADASDDDAVL